MMQKKAGLTKMVPLSNETALINYIIKRQYEALTDNGFIGREKDFDKYRDILLFLYEEHSRIYKSRMQPHSKEMDKHRQAACITATLMDAQIMVATGKSTDDVMLFFPNEVLAALSSASHIHFAIAKCLSAKPSARILNIGDFVRLLDSEYPPVKDDEGEYFTSLLHVIRCERERAFALSETKQLDDGTSVSVGNYNYAALSNIYYFYDLHISKQIKKEISRVFDRGSRKVPSKQAMPNRRWAQ